MENKNLDYAELVSNTPETDSVDKIILPAVNYKKDGHYEFYSSADPNNPMRFEIEKGRLYLIAKIKSPSKKSSNKEVEENSETDNPSNLGYREVYILLANRPIFVLFHYWDHHNHDSHMHEIGFFENDGTFVDGIMIKDSDVQATMSANKVISELRDKGIVFGTMNPTLVGNGIYNYLLCLDNVPEGHIIKKIGWTNSECKVYALHSAIIQSASDSIRYIPVTNSPKNAFENVGTLEGWINTIAKMAVENPMLVFAISIGFAGPLLRVLNIPAGDDGGFNFHGLHGTGKTTLLEVASTVFGCRESQMKSWSSTTNHFESVAESRNDNTLIIDEMGRISNPKDLNKVIYGLAGGDGKGRLDSNANEKTQRRFRTIILSTSEKPISMIAAESGIHIEGGVEDRLASIPADGGKGIGVFSELHGYNNPADFAQALKKLTSRDCNEEESNYGIAGLEFIKKLIDLILDLPEFRKQWQNYRSDFLRSLNAEEVSRVGSRFALAGFAGELATEFGLTGWKKDEATKAAKYCFLKWVREHHGAGHELAIALSKLAEHINSTKTTRFPNLGSDNKYKVTDRSYIREIDGFVRVVNQEVIALHIEDTNVVSGELINLSSEEIWIRCDAVKRVSGFDSKVMGGMLKKAGWLTEDSVNSRNYISRPRITGPSQTSVYKLNNAYSTLDLENNSWGRATYVYEDSEHRVISLELTPEELNKLPKYRFAIKNKTNTSISSPMESLNLLSEMADDYPVYAYKISSDGVVKQVGDNELDEILKNKKGETFISKTGNPIRLTNINELVF